MPKHKVGTREEWSAARKELLEREQDLGKLDEELAKQRKGLPWVAVEKEQRRDRSGLRDGRVAGLECLRTRGRRRLPHVPAHRARPLPARSLLFPAPRPDPGRT